MKKVLKIDKYKGGHYIIFNNGQKFQYVLFYKGNWYINEFIFTTPKTRAYTIDEQVSCLAAVKYAVEQQIKQLRQRSLLTRFIDYVSQLKLSSDLSKGGDQEPNKTLIETQKL